MIRLLDTALASCAWTTALSFMLVALACDAHAQLELSAEGGAVVHAGSIEIGGALPPVDVGVGPTYAIGLGWALTENVAVQLRWQQIFAELEIDDPRPSDATLDVSGLTVGARYEFLAAERRLRPWIDVGVGWYQGVGEGRIEDAAVAASGRVVDLRVHQDGDAVGVTVAGGASIHLIGRVSALVSIRYHYASKVDALTPLAGLRVRFE